MSRSLSQAITHTVTLKQDFMEEKKDRAFKLFDDGDVFDEEIMTFRKPSPGFALLVKNWELYPELFRAVKNPKYHQHNFHEKTIFVCACGDIKDE